MRAGLSGVFHVVYRENSLQQSWDWGYPTIRKGDLEDGFLSYPTIRGYPTIRTW